MYLVGIIAVLLVVIYFLVMRVKKELGNIENIKVENNNFKEKYSGIIDQDKEIEVRKEELNQVLKNINFEKEKVSRLIEIQTKLEESTANLEEKFELQSFGFYKPKYVYENSDNYKKKLDDIYEQQKYWIKNKKAALCTTEWTIDGNKAKGRKMTNDNLKMMLRAFNGEADSAIAKVKYNNLQVMEKRIETSRDNINKLSVANACKLNEEYVDLKLEELYLNYEYAQKVQEEKEEQRLIKEQMREEEKARKEYEKAIKDAENEEKRQEKALEQARKEYEKIMLTKSETERQKYLEKITLLEERLDAVKHLKERAVSQAQLTRAGHVYIISNIGSFGENVYKIGMTRRLEPEDRVKELSGASVPFPFDIHALIYSEDAPGLENLLHKNFSDKRMNLINQRREFFEISLDEVEKFIKENYGEFKLTRFAEAEQFRQTISLKNENIIPEISLKDEIDKELEELDLTA